MGHVLFTLDAIAGNVIQQLAYDWLPGGGQTMADTAGVETAARGRELILERMADVHTLDERLYGCVCMYVIPTCGSVNPMKLIKLHFKGWQNQTNWSVLCKLRSFVCQVRYFF